MERNPFEVILSSEFESLQEENLDFLMLGIKRTNELSWQFNPWHHRVINYIVEALTPSTKNTWIVDDPDEYTGIERRNKVRDALEDFITSCRRTVVIAMMPRTKKIEQLKDVA